MKHNLYRGYDSFTFDNTKRFRLSDIDLVKKDLLNEIFTLRGERVMHPTFGSSIPELVFEPLDDDLLDTIREELEAVVKHDPRVELIDLTLVPKIDSNYVECHLLLFYVELNVTNDFELYLEFSSDAG